MNARQLLKQAQDAVLQRYRDQFFPGFELLHGVPARVIAYIEPDTLRYGVERYDPKTESWVHNTRQLYVDREEAVVVARKAAARSRFPYRVIEIHFPEDFIWPPQSEKE